MTNALEGTVAVVTGTRRIVAAVCFDWVLNLVWLSCIMRQTVQLSFGQRGCLPIGTFVSPQDFVRAEARML
jgi:hypothetical protein